MKILLPRIAKCRIVNPYPFHHRMRKTAQVCPRSPLVKVVIVNYIFMKYPVDKLCLDLPSPNSLQDMCYRIISKFVLSFVNSQRFPDWHLHDFCLAKNALVDIFGFLPVFTYFVLPPLDYHSYCSCWSYVNKIYDPSTDESDDEAIWNGYTGHMRQAD